MIIGKAISPFALRKKGTAVVPTDADAQLFITATGISGTNATATNQLVIDLKAANIWTKMKAIYPMVGGTATTCKFNLKDSRDLNAAYRLTFFGGGTFSSNGYQSNGTNSYADTFLIPSTAFANTNNHLSFYSRTSANVGITDMGAYWTNSPATNPSTYTAVYSFGVGRSIDTNAVGYLSNDDTNRIQYTQTNASGMFVLSRTANNSLKMYQNNILKQTNTVVASSVFNTLPQNSIFIGATNYRDSGTVSVLQYSAKQCAFASIGDGLTDAEALALYNAVNAFQVSLARNV
jgi:hypothetical protein